MIDASSGRPRLIILHKVLVTALVAVLLAALAACGVEDPPGDEWSEVRDSAGSASQSQPADDGGGSAVASNSDTVSHSNPNPAGMPLNDREVTASSAESLDAVTWTTEPVIEAGALVAAGTLTQGARLAEPTGDEPSAFSVYYGAHAEVMVELLPDLGATHVWDTDATVAPSELEQEGNEFTVRAYSPLFTDVGPSDLLLRVWGYDDAGNAALLSVQTVAAGRR